MPMNWIAALSYWLKPGVWDDSPSVYISPAVANKELLIQRRLKTTLSKKEVNGFLMSADLFLRNNLQVIFIYFAF